MKPTLTISAARERDRIKQSIYNKIADAMKSDLQPLERAAYVTKFFDILERESSGQINAEFDLAHKSFAITIWGHEYFLTIDEAQTFVIGWNSSKTFNKAKWRSFRDQPGKEYASECLLVGWFNDQGQATRNPEVALYLHNANEFWLGGYKITPTHWQPIIG